MMAMGDTKLEPSGAGTTDCNGDTMVKIAYAHTRPPSADWVLPHLNETCIVWYCENFGAQWIPAPDLRSPCWCCTHRDAILPEGSGPAGPHTDSDALPPGHWHHFDTNSDNATGPPAGRR